MVGLLSMLRRETAALRSLLTHGSMQLVDKGQFGVPGSCQCRNSFEQDTFSHLCRGPDLPEVSSNQIGS